MTILLDLIRDGCSASTGCREGHRHCNVLSRDTPRQYVLRLPAGSSLGSKAPVFSGRSHKDSRGKGHLPNPREPAWDLSRGSPFEQTAKWPASFASRRQDGACLARAAGPPRLLRDLRARLWYAIGMLKVKSPAERGRLGARAFLRNVAPKDRREIARLAALARWGRTPKAKRRAAARMAVLARWSRVRRRAKSR